MDPVRGRVWKFGDNVNTDVIVPGRYLDVPLEESSPHVFESVKPEFAGGVKKGDIIVAGSNFGCGSSRESAPEVLKILGIGCVVADSFGRIFFRNAIAVGLPALACRGVSAQFEDGDIARVDVVRAVVENLTRGITLHGEPLSAEMLLILDCGGILKLLKGIAEGEG